MRASWLRRIAIFVELSCLIFLFVFNPNARAQTTNETPANFKIAFIADQGTRSKAGAVLQLITAFFTGNPGTGNKARAVLQLIKDEGANAVIHSGDFDYTDDPAGWDNTINSILGPDFPYFASIGNHDTKKWDGAQGYQHYLEARCNRLGVAWKGDLGVQSSLKYKGIFIVFTAPGIRGIGHDKFIRDQLENDNSIWSICSWHRNMKKMQAGGNSDETGWGVYEEARKGGAIIATGHEHSYSRTYLLSDMQNQTIVSKSDILVLTKGNSFAFVSGLGGKSVRSQKRNGDYFASIYTSDQKASPGVLFGEFNYNGVANLAHFYFKDIRGRVPDEFWVISRVEGNVSAVNPAPASIISQYILKLNDSNTFNSR